MSEIKVNKISPRANCGTVQLGDSGDTITIPAGATITNNGTQTGFGRTGAVDWQTSIKTTDFTASNGEGYFVNTSGGSDITVTLPSSPSAGNIVALADYAGTAATNKIIINRNGSNFEGGTANGEITVNRQAVTLVFADSTQGWLPVGENDSSFQGASYIAATGGNTTATAGDYKIHTFTSPGTFCVSNAGNAVGNNKVSYLVVAGGGGGGAGQGAGGGAGGFREGKAPNGCYTASPLALTGGLTVPASAIPITVGGGGSAGSSPPFATGPGGAGSLSTFSSITSAGGGLGASNCSSSNIAGGNGGSGGGGSSGGPGSGAAPAGNGNTPSVVPPQGNNGGQGYHYAGLYQVGGGGGGAGAVGATSPTGPSGVGGNGGNGVTTSINNTPTAYAGGGGGGAHATPSTTAGTGGTGGGGNGQLKTSTAAQSGTTNTGGGGGGGGCSPTTGAAGGSGIVIIRYKFQN